MEFARAVRDQYRAQTRNVGPVEEIGYFGCLIRQDGMPYRSGSTYLVLLTPDGRVHTHAKTMRFSSRQLNPLIFGTILHSLGVSRADLTNLLSPDRGTAAQAGAAMMGVLLREPDAPFDATIPVPGLRPGIPGASGLPPYMFRPISGCRSCSWLDSISRSLT